MLAVLRQRNFCWLWWGQIVSSMGDFALGLALPYYTYQLTGSVLATGIAALAANVPRAILGSVAGVLLVPFVTKLLHSDATGMSWIFVGRGVGGLIGGGVFEQKGAASKAVDAGSDS